MVWSAVLQCLCGPPRVWGLAGAGEWREGRSASRGPLPPLGEARRASAASLPTMSPRTGGLSPTAHKTNKNPAYSSRSLARAGGDPVLLPYPSFGLSVFFLLPFTLAAGVTPPRPVRMVRCQLCTVLRGRNLFLSVFLLQHTHLTAVPNSAATVPTHTWHGVVAVEW